MDRLRQTDGQNGRWRFDFYSLPSFLPKEGRGENFPTATSKQFLLFLECVKCNALVFTTLPASEVSDFPTGRRRPLHKVNGLRFSREFRRPKKREVSGHKLCPTTQLTRKSTCAVLSKRTRKKIDPNTHSGCRQISPELSRRRPLGHDEEAVPECHAPAHAHRRRRRRRSPDGDKFLTMT